MKVIIQKGHNPYFNLSVEEFLLKQCDDNFFMLWQNDRSIIVGRNQNTYAEINTEYVTDNNIPVVRRLTGGGAVFHDLGNLNYTFIQNDGGKGFGNYEAFARPIIAVLSELGIKVVLSGRNDMLIDGKKFSGNAQTSWHGRTLHHGTLMFSSNVTSMTDALNVNPLKIKSKGIKSVKSRVTNINEHLEKPILIPEFCTLACRKILSDGKSVEYSLDENDIVAVNTLCDEKYSTWAWNYGYKKEYSFQKDALFPSGLIQVKLNIDRGIITDARIEGDYFGIRDISEFETALAENEYNPQKIRKFLDLINIGDFFSGISADQLLTAMF